MKNIHGYYYAIGMVVGCDDSHARAQQHKEVFSGGHIIFVESIFSVAKAPFLAENLLYIGFMLGLY